jgi:hypothetical protein
LAGERVRGLRHGHEQQKASSYQEFCKQDYWGTECGAGGDETGMLSGISICYLRIDF